MTGGPLQGPFPWQRQAWDGLVERLRGGRLPHALLISGPQGLGKRHFALAFAQGVLCESPTETGRGCGTCRRCTLFVAGSHPDFVDITPEEEGKDITIGQIRELSGRLGLHPQYGSRRVVLIEPADRMNTNAANALLKTLEEPAEGTLLMLISSRPSALLPTIRSRCQTVAFRQPPASEVREWMASQLGAADDPDLLLALAGGAPLGALAMSNGELRRHREQTLEELEGVLAGTTDPVGVAERWAGEEPAAILDWAYGMVADAIRLAQGEESVTLSHPDLRQRLQALAETVDLTGLFRQLDRIAEARRMMRGQLNKQLLVEEVLIAWSRTGRR